MRIREAQIMPKMTTVAFNMARTIQKPVIKSKRNITLELMRNRTE
jgi:hypothetical protein